MPLANPMQDLSLVAEAKNGAASPSERAKAFAALYHRHQGSLYRFAKLRSGSADTAADIVQEIFLGLITDQFQFEPSRGALQNFLFGIARNLILKRESGYQRFVALDTDDEDNELVLIDPARTPIEKLLSDARAERVRDALMKLAPHYRDVLILYEMHDLSYIEIAQICNIDIGTVRSRLSRARARMMVLLADLGHTEPHAVQIR